MLNEPINPDGKSELSMVEREHYGKRKQQDELKG